MQQSLPVTIHKSVVGLIAYFLFGLVLLGLIFLGLYMTIDAFDPVVIMGTAILLVLMISAVIIVQMYVYALSSITLTDEGLTSVYWSSLFSKQTVQAEWVQVEDVTVEQSQGGWLAFAFNYGTLVVQTAGTAQNLRLTMVPNAEYWQAVIMANADAATDLLET